MKYKKTKYEGISEYQTSSKIKKYRVRIGYEIDGKRKEHSKQGFDTIELARAYQIQMESQLITGGDVRMAGNYRTLNQQWESLKSFKIRRKKWNLATQETNSDRIQPWLDKFGHMPMKDITPNDAENFILDLYDEYDYSQETMKGFLKLFNAVINDAVDDGYLERNVYSKVIYDKPNEWEPKEKVIDLDVYHKFMEASKEKMRPDVYRCLYLAAFGLRRGEVYAIRESVVTFLPNGLASVNINCARTAKYPDGHDVKTRGSKRIIVVDEIGTQFLKEQINEARLIKAKFGEVLHKEDYIFITPKTGKPYYIKTLNDYMGRIAKTIDRDLRVTPHILRHMFATYASASGVDAIQLRNFLGHTDVEMTKHYSKGSAESAEKVMRLTSEYRKFQM